MPVDPGVGESLAARVAAIVADAELALLRLLAQRLREGDDETWTLTRLAQVQQLRLDLQRGVRTFDQQVVAGIQQVVLEAYNLGAGLAVQDLDDADVPAVVLADPVGAAAAAAAPAAANAREAVRRLPQVLTAAYVEAVQAGAAEVTGGKVTRLQASQHVLDRLTANGVGSFVDRSGRRWALTSYVEMATRTATGQAAVQGHVDSLSAAGLDLVVVSDAPRECPLCRPWEGKVLSTSGRMVGDVVTRSVTSRASVRVRVAGSLEQARADGFQHPNCRHSVSAYLPGATPLQRPRSDPDGYEAAQRQRAMERRLREWKRREALALTPEAAARARVKTRQWSAALAEHVDENDLKRLRRRERPTGAT
ncbi:hypothetical protein GCM10027586_03870 [Kineococcus gypseus]|uniref:phage minor capsid protein n=1 Tax=Kineococcus gypseus TaxID=1637102 RepID=UPI003D7E315B